MLTKWDEALFHQDGRPAAYASTTDHRFYDRYWVGMYDPSGTRGIITGMGVYKNMDAIDGFVCYQQDQKQYNVRVARPLAPEFEQVVGPLRHEIVEPLRVKRYVLEEGDHGLACDLTWTASTPPFEERFHWLTYGPRIVHDYFRYDQAGFVNGWIKFGNEEIEVENWGGLRDHAWGTRSGVGGYEPYTGRVYGKGFLYQWLCWGNDEIAGYVQIHRTGENRPIHTDGLIRFVGRDDEEPLELLSGEVHVEFVPETRVYQRAVANIRMHDGSEWEIVAEPMLTAFAMHGAGYDRGYRDLKGHGYHRPHGTLEHDVYDISDLRQAYYLPSGEAIRSVHREQPASITCNGKKAIGHFTVVPTAPLPQFGFMDNNIRR
jgi:hypothetical protein